MENELDENYWIREDVAKAARHSVYSGRKIYRGDKCYKLHATQGSITKEDILELASQVIPEHLKSASLEEAQLKRLSRRI